MGVDSAIDFVGGRACAAGSDRGWGERGRLLHLPPRHNTPTRGTALWYGPDPVSLREGDIIHQRYRLLRLIGTGTSGAVWAARNELIDREVALKILEPEVMSDKVLATRFFNEAKSIGRVKHPSIVGIFDLGQAEDGSPFLVLELLDGEPLSTKILRDGPMEPETLFDFVSSIAKALDLAHHQGIVHRDLKPANIFLHRTGTGSLIGKLLDFGISKVLTGGATNFTLTKTGTVTDTDVGVIWSHAMTSPRLKSHSINFAGSDAVEIAVSIDIFFVIPMDLPPGVSLVQKYPNWLVWRRCGPAISRFSILSPAISPARSPE